MYVVSVEISLLLLPQWKLFFNRCSSALLWGFWSIVASTARTLDVSSRQLEKTLMTNCLIACQTCTLAVQQIASFLSYFDLAGITQCIVFSCCLFCMMVFFDVGAIISPIIRMCVSYTCTYWRKLHTELFAVTYVWDLCKNFNLLFKCIRIRMCLLTVII